MARGYQDRSLKSGARMSEAEFLTEMRKAGFQVVETRPNAEWEFVHPQTEDRRYLMLPKTQYSDALARILKEFHGR